MVLGLMRVNLWLHCCVIGKWIDKTDAPSLNSVLIALHRNQRDRKDSYLLRMEGDSMAIVGHVVLYGAVSNDTNLFCIFKARAWKVRGTWLLRNCNQGMLSSEWAITESWGLHCGLTNDLQGQKSRSLAISQWEGMRETSGCLSPELSQQSVVTLLLKSSDSADPLWQPVTGDNPFELYLEPKEYFVLCFIGA